MRNKRDGADVPGPAGELPARSGRRLADGKAPGRSRRISPKRPGAWRFRCGGELPAGRGAAVLRRREVGGAQRLLVDLSHRGERQAGDDGAGLRRVEVAERPDDQAPYLVEIGPGPAVR